MAVRIYWGENANFLLTVGGFHPAYTPPPMGLGPLERLSIDIFTGLAKTHPIIHLHLPPVLGLRQQILAPAPGRH